MFQAQHPWQARNSQFSPIPQLNRFQTQSPVNVSSIAPGMQQQAQGQQQEKSQLNSVLDKIPGLIKDFKKSTTEEKTADGQPSVSPWKQMGQDVGDAWDWVKNRFQSETPATPSGVSAPILPNSPMAQIQQPSAQAGLGREVAGINPALAGAFGNAPTPPVAPPPTGGLTGGVGTNALAGGAGADVLANIAGGQGGGIANAQNIVQSGAGLGANNPAALASLVQGNPFLKSQNLQNGIFGILGQGGGFGTGGFFA